MRAMSKDNQTILYRWIIGGMMAVIAYFLIKIDSRVDRMYDSYIQQHLIDDRQNIRIGDLELNVKELQRAQTYVSASRSTTTVN